MWKEDILNILKNKNSAQKEKNGYLNYAAGMLVIYFIIFLKAYLSSFEKSNSPSPN